MFKIAKIVVSRKLSLIVKSWNFHTVCTSYSNFFFENHKLRHAANMKIFLLKTFFYLFSNLQLLAFKVFARDAKDAQLWQTTEPLYFSIVTSSQTTHLLKKNMGKNHLHWKLKLIIQKMIACFKWFQKWNYAAKSVILTEIPISEPAL